jgi:glycosyltransferase involved in cell wall biosynthesis
MKKWIDRYADAIFGASHATLESIWGPQWRQNSRIHFQPNGIDISKYKESVDPKEVRKNLQLPEDCRIVLTVGRHVPHKKHIIIPKIASLICQEYSDVYFVIVGSGPLQSQVEKRVEQKGLQSRFRFLSKVPSLISLWKSSDVFLFPSTQEGFGIVVVEAAAAGLPVVARRIPGVTEAITACHEAILMDLDASVESWAQGVETALRKGKLEIKDYDEFEKKFPFTIRESVDALLKAYRRIVG